MIKKIGFTILLIATFQSSVFADDQVCIKNGRQYYIELANYLGLSANLGEYKRKFIELSNNLPKKGLQSEFAPSLPSLVQLSDRICVDYANQMFPLVIETVRFKKGDGLFVGELIAKEVFGSGISLRSKDLFDGYLDERRFDAYRIENACDEFIVGQRYENRYPKDPNFDRNSYCYYRALDIYKMLEDRNKAEAEKMKPKTASTTYQYLKVINQTYKKILRRFSTTKEIDTFKAMELESENSAAYSACLAAAASQEFIKNGKCK
jgi:hypothetical protein